MLDPVALLQELVRTPSPFGEEHGAVAIVEREIARLGLETTAAPFESGAVSRLPGAQPPFSQVGGRRNLIARIAGTGGGRSIIINAHLDTVPEGDPSLWRHPPFAGVIEDGRVYGRGSFDDKAGAVICLALLERFSQQRLRGDLIAQFVLEDEITGNGSLLCLDQGPLADGAIIVDGTKGDRGINQHAGNVRFGVSVFGTPASVSVSHMGVNAAEMLARLLLEIRGTILAWNAGNAAPWTQYPSPNQCSVLSLACPESTLTVPALASAACYATFTPPRTLASFRESIEATARHFAAAHRLDKTPEIDWRGFATEPVASASAPLESAIRVARRTDLEFGPSTGTSDMRHFAARGIPCVLFGPGRGANPHRADEYFEIGSLVETAEILGRAIRSWCA